MIFLKRKIRKSLKSFIIITFFSPSLTKQDPHIKHSMKKDLYIHTYHTRKSTQFQTTNPNPIHFTTMLILTLHFCPHPCRLPRDLFGHLFKRTQQKPKKRKAEARKPHQPANPTTQTRHKDIFSLSTIFCFVSLSLSLSVGPTTTTFS